MSKYTITVRSIVEMFNNSDNFHGYDDIDTLCETAAPQIFNFDWPIFDELYRIILEKKFLKHFYNREICCETIGMWQLYLCNTFNEIMPKYNVLYNSKIDELLKTPYTENVEHKITKKEKNTNKFSDTPQGSLNNLLNDTYLTNVTINDNSADNKDNYITKKGNVWENIQHWDMVNIDRTLFNELEILFFRLW